MTKQEERWFDKLSKKRNKTATELMNDFAIGNMWQSVVEKYSDQAHFIYELLQNANDAKATLSSFYLTNKGLYFTHNGTRNFSISNPDTEERDQKGNKLGDINAITAVAQSNKKNESTIGKFGVGFKAVFQYTETPHIYDPKFQFKIENFIVPIKLKDDLVERKKDETIFYFPFNKKEMPAKTAYSDISEKLKKLVYPTLFLSNLKKVEWKTDKYENGEYSKKSITEILSGDITYEKIEIYQQIGLNITEETLYLFSRVTERHKYSIGYFLDNNEGKLMPKEFSAFCFFPTKEITNLNFILHAPFLLVDSRETIKRDEKHNVGMVNLLAQLAADSLLILKDLNLIDDDIVNIIPYKKPTEDDFFAPFYDKIKQKFQIEEILPAKDKVFSRKENSYWAYSPDLANLFSNKQLSDLVGKENAKWVFSTIGRTRDKDITSYIDGSTSEKREPNLIKASMDFENKIADLITSDFIKNQSDDWLHKFYEYLSERKSYQDNFRTKPIFKDKQGNAVAAFEKKGDKLYSILFLPADYENSSFVHIQSDFLENEKTKKFIENFGVKYPSLEDEIYNHILPQYDHSNEIDIDSHFKIFFKYWKDQGRPESFITLIKDKKFISVKREKDETIYQAIASWLYYPSEDLKKYFEYKPTTNFVNIENYYKFIEKEDKEILKDFLLKLGVNFLPKIIKFEITDKYDKECLNLKQSTYGHSDKTINKLVDGYEELLGTYDIMTGVETNNINTDTSLILWRYLIIQSKDLKGEHTYYHYVEKKQPFDSMALTILKEKKWLLSKNNVFVSPNEITFDELVDGYETNEELERMLGFKSTVILTEEQGIASMFGSVAEAKEAKQALEEKRTKENLKAEQNILEVNTRDDLGDAIKSLNNLSKSTPKQKSENEQINISLNFDENEELAKGIEELKKQLQLKKNRVSLTEKINSSEKYSYDWFKSYLELLTTYVEKQDTTKQKSISFQKIKPYKTGNKYFLLCGTATYISPEIENFEDFKVSLIFVGGKKEEITVEGVSKKGQDLLIYCRAGLPENISLDLSKVFKVEINFTPIIDLLERLYKAFTNSGYINEWQDIKKALPPLNYIYGPPGTGKTTTLCHNIKDILKDNPNAKILVLTPTNKASDVVCKKLIDINSEILAVRLSRVTDPELKESAIYYDTPDEVAIYRDTINERDMDNISVVASTIHRLPYFNIQNPENSDLLLFQYKWNYVIFDESSMIGLHYITFALMALFNSNPDIKFIIAGDPKQIPPVVNIDDKELENFDFQDENIYKMMSLESFKPEEQTIRDDDKIKNLDTQYRSVPEIGQLFSELSYSGLLKHDRETNKKEAKPLPEKFKEVISSNVTFIDIPLKKEDSIYKINKLFYSSYHIYCTILVTEIIKYFDGVNKDKDWTIGLIAPYKTQATLLNKLTTSYGISENIKVYADTVHGFQGDECDIVFFICNPNNYHYSGHKKALLSKEYIYNVAISRAKDYLIILHPYTAIGNNIFINNIEYSYKNNFGDIKILDVKNIEKVLFNEESHIEANSYVSGHDSVNIFGTSEMKYFIKSNDTAIDIHIKK